MRFSRNILSRCVSALPLRQIPGRMLTRYILHIGEEEYSLRDDDLKNWDEVKCSFKRSNYDGIVRSYSSQFEFVNRAKALVWQAYLQKGFDADASIEILTMNDRWRFLPRFSYPLDFSTLSVEGQTLKINGVDNSLQAIVKASKSTTYEFEVGGKIKADNTLLFDRIPMKESITYAFTKGLSAENSADISVNLYTGRPWVGNIADEVAVNRCIGWNDDQEDTADSYMFRAYKDVEVTLEYEFEWLFNTVYESGVGIAVCIERTGTAPIIQNIVGIYHSFYRRVKNGEENDFPHAGALPADPKATDPLYDPEKETPHYWATVRDEVYTWDYNGDSTRYAWNGHGVGYFDYFTERRTGTIPLSLKDGDKVYLYTNMFEPQAYSAATVGFRKSNMRFCWIARGDAFDVPIFKPQTVVQTILDEMVNGKVFVNVEISDFDERIKNTYLVASESLRGIDGAKLYTSYNEFADWMSTVFGYVPFISEPTNPDYRFIRDCRIMETSDVEVSSEPYRGKVDTGNIWYLFKQGMFAYKDSDGIYHRLFSGCEDYNGKDGHVRTDVVFRMGGILYIFNEWKGEPLYPYTYLDDVRKIGVCSQTIRFMHRSEVMNADGTTRVFADAGDIKYTVDAGSIYSSLTIGYDKKDFDNTNGRNEFNFTNTYDTGCSSSEKSLSMISKYRADSYGMEFDAQKRGKDTTDGQSDKDVFFLLCRKEEGRLVPDRSIPIKSGLEGAAFNGAFTPMACVRANAGFIGLQANPLKLLYASCTGNSDALIGEETMTSDIVLDTPLATCGVVEFSTEEVDETSIDSLIEITDGDFIYRGFLKEVDVRYPKAEAASYKLIVKEIKQ